MSHLADTEWMASNVDSYGKCQSEAKGCHTVNGRNLATVTTWDGAKTL